MAASWAGWAVSSLASKFYRTKTSPDPKSNASQTSSNANKDYSESHKSDVERSQTPSIQKSESGDSAAEFDEEVWGSIDADNSQTINARKSLDGWDEDWNDNEFAENESKSVDQKTDIKTKPEEDDFFGKFTNESTNTKTSVSSKNWSKTERIRTDSSESDDKVVTSNISAVSSDEQQTKLEQRRQIRTKDNEERKPRKTVKGPMKLGAQRIT